MEFVIVQNNVLGGSRTGDLATIQFADATGTTASAGVGLPPGSGLSIFIVKYIDASNFCAQLLFGGGVGSEVEIFADGGDIVVGAFSIVLAGTFLGGASSYTISANTGRRFRYLPPVGQWAPV